MNRKRQEFLKRNKQFNINGTTESKGKSAQRNRKCASVDNGAATDTHWKKPFQQRKSLANKLHGEPKTVKSDKILKNNQTTAINGNDKVVQKNHSSPTRTPKTFSDNKLGQVDPMISKSTYLSQSATAKSKLVPKQADDFSKTKKRKMKTEQSMQTKRKISKASKSDSDSDADEYIDQFFQDVSDDDANAADSTSEHNDSIDSSGMSESNSEDDAFLDSSADSETQVMGIEELLDYYGNYKDNVKTKSSGGTKSKKKNTDKINKKSKVADKAKNSSANVWIEEDNTVGLVYKDSDDELPAPVTALVPVGNSKLASSEEDSDFSPGELITEDESSNDSDGELLSFEYNSSEDSSDGSDSDDNSDPYYDDHEFSSDYDSDEEDSSEEEESYWDDSYDSEDDEDYCPDDDDLYIGRGDAKIYEIDDNNVSFNSDIESAQIIELPGVDGRKSSMVTSATESQTEDDDKGSCPELVPIYDSTGRLIDSVDLLAQEKSEVHKDKRPKQPMPPPAENVDAKNVEEDDSVVESVVGRSLKETQTKIEEGEMNTEVESTDYKFYDAIDGRMALLVLKDTLHLCGYLIVQPLIGNLEVMGYNLKQGECKKVFATRGYHSINLSPCPNKAEYTKEVLEEVIVRLTKHFLFSDLKELQQQFDPLNSVLLLLQSDSNDLRKSIVEKYMPNEWLFPKGEFLKASVNFTSEYLLNVQFSPKKADKQTAHFEKDAQWDAIKLKKDSKIVMVGGKGSGKSTLCQYFINQLVSEYKRVLLIDLDIGQPIIHIPETISVTIVKKPLLGVAAFDPITPSKAWLFGSLNVVSSPIFYIKNVQQLAEYCKTHKNEFANIPWVINTMGYCTGFGEELMVAILKMLEPTDVVQIVAQNPALAIPNFKNSLTSEFVNQYKFNIFQSEMEKIHRKAAFIRHQINLKNSRKGHTLAAPKRRNLQIIAHLANILDDSCSDWFNEVKPICAPLDQMQILVTREDRVLTQQQLPSVLNATLVYLCRKLDNGLYECLGIGIVRGIDKNNNVYLLQALSNEELSTVTVLAICSSSLPNTIFLQQSTRIQGKIPYVYNIA